MSAPHSSVFTSHDTSSHLLHGWLSVSYSKTSLNVRRHRSSKEENSAGQLSFEDCFKHQHEITVSVQPFDSVLWCPVIVSAVQVFDLKETPGNTMLSQSSHDCSSSKDDVLSSVTNLPLLDVTLSSCRVFFPVSEVHHSPQSSIPVNKTSVNSVVSQEDLLFLHLSSVTVSSTPDNPISRLVIDKKTYKALKHIGRSARHSLGFDVHDKQYQLDVANCSLWSGRWSELCGVLTKVKTTEGELTDVDQNPALEWNTQEL